MACILTWRLSRVERESESVKITILLIVISLHVPYHHQEAVTNQSKTVGKGELVPSARCQQIGPPAADDGYSSWLTSDKLSSIRKRAKKLSMIHHIKTRPGQPKEPSNRRALSTTAILSIMRSLGSRYEAWNITLISPRLVDESSCDLIPSG
eukprot:scaffold958_cov128-Skeletonema_dohrnii-CCMP3373.AAC.7